MSLHCAKGKDLCEECHEQYEDIMLMVSLRKRRKATKREIAAAILDYVDRVTKNDV